MQHNNMPFSKTENQRGLSHPGEGSPIFILTLTMAVVVLVLAPECLAAPYTLTVTASHGSVTVTPNKAQYNEGEAVELKTKPDTGYSFTGWAGDARGKSLVLNLTMNGNKTVTANFGIWQPPIGIPVPQFGIFETYRMYDVPANRNPDLTYTQNAEGGYYTHYIDKTASNATDTSNPYGTVAKPRLTIPADLPAGSVVEVHSGYYGSGGYALVTGHGTEAMPIFVSGVDLNANPFTSRVRIKGTYLIVEGIEVACDELSALYAMAPPKNKARCPASSEP